MKNETKGTWRSLFLPDSCGSEGGIICADEEYEGTCRITLEKCKKYYAITCGVYGEMVHTVFCGAENYQDIYNSMKDDLARFIDSQLAGDEAYAFYDSFCSKY